MTDQITSESGVEQVKTELPTPTFTETSSGSSTSTVDTEALAARVADMLRPTIEKSVQSVKDKRIAEIEKRLGQSDLEDIGVELTPEQQFKLRLRDLEAKVNQPVQQVSQASGAVQDSEKVSAVIKEYGLDANRPEVIKLLSGNYRNFDHFQAEAGKLAFKQLSAAPPGASAAPSIGGGGGQTGLSKEQVSAKYQELSVLMTSPRVNAAKIAELQKELTDLGIPVD